MEKIQKAIAKARSAQGKQTPPPARTPLSTPQLGSDPAPSGEISALKALHLDADQLRIKRVMTLEACSEATVFDVMRTRTLQTMRANNWRRVGITSPSPTCGKSTLALNLAFSLARQPELRTFLGETDMHRPSFKNILGGQTSHGFASVLRGHVPFDRQAHRWGDTLALSFSTGDVVDSSELLQSQKTASCLDEIEAAYRFDVMIFDLPPMLINDDVMAFADKLDCVLLVAAAEHTTTKEIDTCERDLASQTNVMGVVLNKCRYADSTTYAGYYYDTAS